MGLKAYISDDDVVEKLSSYGEIKGQVIRLKYKHDHELAGLENRNRLIRMVLTSASIPINLLSAANVTRLVTLERIVRSLNSIIENNLAISLFTARCELLATLKLLKMIPTQQQMTRPYKIQMTKATLMRRWNNLSQNVMLSKKNMKSRQKIILWNHRLTMHQTKNDETKQTQNNPRIDVMKQRNTPATKLECCTTCEEK